MKCEIVEAELTAFIQGETDPRTARKVRAHLQGCEACRREKDGIDALFALMAIRPGIAVSEDFEARLMARMAPLRATPSQGRISRRTRQPGVIGFLRHRIQSAPLLAASILIHLALISFMTVMLVSGSGPSDLRPDAIVLGTEEQRGNELTDEDLLDRLPRSEELARGQMPPDPDEPLPPKPDIDDPLRQYDGSLGTGTSEVASWFASRMEPEKALRNAGAGESIPAIKHGLRWLVAQQSADGSWPTKQWGADDTFRVGVSGLAMLSLMAQGSSAERGEYSKSVKRGLTWLRTQQNAKGLFGPSRGNYLYNHIIATQVLVENQLLTGKRRGRDGARIRKAVKLLIGGQKPSGGWGYDVNPFGGADSSVTGWVIFLFRVTSELGIQVPPSVLVRSRAWFRSVTDREGRVGYRRMGEGSEGTFPLTCVGLLANGILDPTTDPSKRQVAESVKIGTTSLTAKKPNYSLWYHTTFALRLSKASDDFLTWEPRVRKTVLGLQTTDGNDRGSWAPQGMYGKDGGRVYSTAISLLTLQSHYRYR